MHLFYEDCDQETKKSNSTIRNSRVGLNIVIILS